MRCCISLPFIFAASLAGAQSTQYSCSGADPNWSLTISDDVAVFDFIGEINMTIPQQSRAEGQSWPLAMTLISADYSSTAILILNERNCTYAETDSPIEALVLTQRNDQPILLAGCCVRP